MGDQQTHRHAASGFPWRAPVGVLCRLGAMALGVVLLAQLAGVAGSGAGADARAGLALAGRLIATIAGMVVLGVLSLQLELKAEKEGSAMRDRRVWVIAAALAGVALLGLLFFADGDPPTKVHAAAFLIPSASLFLLWRWVEAERKVSRPGAPWVPAVVIGWMLAAFMGSATFASWFDVIPVQTIVACQVYRSHGWKVSTTLARGRVVDLPYTLPLEGCAPPTCPAIGTLVERRRGEGGYRIGGVFRADGSGSPTFPAITGFGLSLLLAGLWLRAHERGRWRNEGDSVYAARQKNDATHGGKRP